MTLFFTLFYLTIFFILRVISHWRKFVYRPVQSKLCYWSDLLGQTEFSSPGSSVCQRTDQVVSSTVEFHLQQSTSEPLFSPVFMALIHVLLVLLFHSCNQSCEGYHWLIQSHSQDYCKLQSFIFHFFPLFLMHRFSLCDIIHRRIRYGVHSSTRTGLACFVCLFFQ